MSEHALLSTRAVLLRAGCTLIPKYNRPAAPLAGVFPGGPARSATRRKSAGVRVNVFNYER
jgi:outer membrane protein, multidrug efflux system